MLIVFAAILYFISPDKSGAGEKIFDKVFTGLSPIAGGIIAYLFATVSKSPTDSDESDNQVEKEADTK